MIGDLPKSVLVNGKEFTIRSDFRDVLHILCAFNDCELDDSEKVYVCLTIFYPDVDSIPRSDYEAAFQAAMDFIDYGAKTDNANNAMRIMDWEQDESIIFPAVNKAAGFETRSAEYIHWWTFLGYYMEISDGIFSNVLNLRLKKAKGKKLEKWEREYWQSNKELCVLKPKLSADEQKQRDELNKLLG